MSGRDHFLLADLVGEDVASVIFVRDHVQLDFDGPRFSLFVWPGVVTRTGLRHWGAPGYRDALCGLIGQTVTAAEESREAGLVVRLGACSVTVKPRPDEVRGPEIAMLEGFADRPDWMVWRPGEPPFDESGRL